MNPLVTKHENIRRESAGSDESPTQDHVPMIRSSGAPPLTRSQAEENLNNLVNSLQHSHQMQVYLWTLILAIANASGKCLFY